MKTWQWFIIGMVIWVLCIAVLFAAEGCGGSGTTAAYMGDPAPSVAVTPGETFLVRVTSVNIRGLDTAQYDISYDPAVLRLLNVTDGKLGSTWLPVSVWGYVPPDAEGTVRVLNNARGIIGISGSGYLAELEFEVIGSGSTRIDIESGILGSTKAEEIPCPWLTELGLQVIVEE